ncbi:hypothetical protein LJY25_08135 [Hymenobacter sp. BT175]|uniref:hypothetical protein n=1 Tax=Hymenobacter translucens TaxID=2886507 RepID=UPI001D0DE1BD|nr:hypothetical protein [Hymenobacter translucens]MCC2546410.1 hypothetical protein [Hymenobacter translucens]
MGQEQNVVQVGEDFYVLKKAGALVEFTGGRVNDTSFGGEDLKVGGLRIAPWGKNNLKPQEMLKLVYGNHLKPQLITTARDFLLGAGLVVYERKIVAGKKVLEEVIDTEMEDFFEYIDGDKLLLSTAFNLEFAGNYFSAFSLDGSRKVERIKSFDATDVRCCVTKKSDVENYAIHPDWANVKAAEAKIVRAYDPRNPTKYGDFLYQGRDWTTGQKYYDIPPYWGTEKWTIVSNKVPQFHISGLDNGYNIKYHIKIPKDYFLQFGDESAQKRAEADLMDSMNEMLAGVENADKAFVSKYGVDSQGKPMPGFQIEPIANTMTDKAYESVNQQANSAHTSGHGIDPSLAGIDTGSKFGGSGSEKRISYQLHIALRTPTKRKILLRQFQIAKQLMGFNPNHVYGFADIEITTLAESKSGKKEGVPTAHE